MEYKENKNTETPAEFAPTPNEFSSDFIVETDNFEAPEFPLIPEYPPMPASPQDPESEQAATTDYDYDDAPETEVSDSYDAESDYDTEVSEELTDNYDIESADDYDNAWDREKNNSEYDYRDEAYEYTDPSDEQAAVYDDDSCDVAVNRVRLDDYEIISDVLGAEKQIVKLYSTALCEAAEDNFRTVLKENLDYAAEDQYKAFEFMSERGMYNTEQASENDISKAKQQLSPLVENDCSCGCNSDYEYCSKTCCGCDTEDK